MRYKRNISLNKNYLKQRTSLIHWNPQQILKLQPQIIAHVLQHVDAQLIILTAILETQYPGGLS